VVLKADNGTYGMGIMTVRDVKDLVNLKPTLVPRGQDHKMGAQGRRRWLTT
jgi:hypothetical protein